MTITKEQQEQMLEAAKPLIKWMNQNCHPHQTIRVELDSVELTESIARTPLFPIEDR